MIFSWKCREKIVLCNGVSLDNSDLLYCIHSHTRLQIRKAKHKENLVCHWAFESNLLVHRLRLTLDRCVKRWNTRGLPNNHFKCVYHPAPCLDNNCTLEFVFSEISTRHSEPPLVASRSSNLKTAQRNIGEEWRREKYRGPGCPWKWQLRSAMGMFGLESEQNSGCMRAAKCCGDSGEYPPLS